MNNAQKTIKYCAIAFAILLAIGIISGIVSAVAHIVNGISGGSMLIGRSNHKTIDFTQSFSEVESINISNTTGELKIKIGEEFKVEAQNVSENFEAKVNNSGELTVSDGSNGFHFLWFNIKEFNSMNSKITIYLPADFTADEAKLETGAGNVSIESLKADYLYISAGAGNIKGTDMTAQKVKVDGGVGSFNLSRINFRDADIECGVGTLDIDGVLLGKSKIDCGVGDVEINLKGNTNDYGFDVDSGIGIVRLNGEKLKASRHYNEDAENTIMIDGGVGNVRINMKE